MKRGDIYFAHLNPTIGSEISKTRPVLIVSNNANNRFSETITIIPLTSQTKKVYPFEVFLSKTDTHLEKDSKAQCHQVRTLSKQRLQKQRAGQINEKIMAKIENALRLHLGL